MAEIDSSAVRRELHGLLDRIPDSDVSTARKLLRSLVELRLRVGAVAYQ